MDSTIDVLLYSTLAAASGGLGALPLIGRSRLPEVWIGWATALAAGLMLGAAYGLSTVPAVVWDLAGATGALLGVLFIFGTHSVVGATELEFGGSGAADPTYAYRILLMNTLHSALEGVAIGVAMRVDLSFGILMALAIAAHNIPEGMILAAVLKSRGARQREALGLAVASKVSQVLLAVAAFAIVSAAPRVLAPVAGFAIGGLIHLVLLELLPESYRRAGSTSIALVTLVATGVVVVLQGVI